ncbi:MAG TPA: prepilin-type N-terminal cleavage/methylation domain-containing protein [Candidatus Limnocylindrales bacterium]|nr:prepilin-type N-terminal cleavage/methylation domain-containing protein [Candidatus Limnocylindrales bacterium]
MKKTNRFTGVASTMQRGFSLVELLVAMLIFLVIGSAAVSLVRQHVPLFSAQQNQAALNIALRNAAAQLQIDVVNAGTGYYQGANIPSWPIGMTIVNNPPGTGCYDPATHTYGQACFDRLNVIAIDSSVPPANPTDIGTNCVSTTSSTLFVNPVAGLTPDQLAADFHTGDQLLLVKSDGSLMTTTILTKDGSTSGGKIELQHNPTGADGTNTTLEDPLAISNTADSNKLGTQFCNNDWVLKLSPITYSVDASDPSNPKLMRTQGGQSNVVSEQIIGFKVGAMIRTQEANGYNFDASTYAYDWTQISAVRISLIGRAPNSDVTNNFRNTFDQGPYKIEAMSVVINPRNLSMNN